MNMLKIEIDGKEIEVAPGSTIIEAADAAGIPIPRFCYHKKLSVAAGMKVATHSAKAIAAQKGVMEFLLINHPLDCPICDQGGECELQDLAMGYGGDVSRYQEMKRVVPDKDLGPLIATEMTRCIHCTRCVRFGQELAGMMELGATGRGEHVRIGTYVAQSVDSELSGNMIDLCPVGALTSKPFRYTARTWELSDVAGVSPHDCVGTNLNVQVQRNRVMRVLPRENEDVNESWLADRDRFSYEALNSPERLLKPMIREAGKWRETDWSTALNVAVDGMQKVIAAHGAQSIGALASPTSTLEEFYLLQKLLRTLGSGNIDHRLRQRDFSDDADAPLFPYLGLPIRELEAVDAALLIGSNIRKDQPLLGLRLRKAFLHSAALFAVNPVDYDFTFDLKAKVITDPAAIPAALARIARVLAEARSKALPAEVNALAGGDVSEAERAIAMGLADAKQGAILLGNFAHSHAQAASLRALADLLAELSGARLGLLPDANSAAGWLAGCLPQRSANGAPAQPAGRNAQDMLAQPLKGYFIFGAEPQLDCRDGALARQALAQAACVVVFSAFKSAAFEDAHVLLPLAPFTETDGTFVNVEGRFQSFRAAVTPAGEARPGWKILRVLGNIFGIAGFDYTTATEVRAELVQPAGTASARLKLRRIAASPTTKGLQRIAEVSMYSIDPLVRRAPALQKTRDNSGPVARMHPREAQKQGVGSSARLRVIAGGENVTLDFLLDRRIPEGCVLIPAGYAETVALGGQDMVHVEAGQ